MYRKDLYYNNMVNLFVKKLTNNKLITKQQKIYENNVLFKYNI